MGRNIPIAEKSSNSMSYLSWVGPGPDHPDSESVVPGLPGPGPPANVLQPARRPPIRLAADGGHQQQARREAPELARRDEGGPAPQRVEEALPRPAATAVVQVPPGRLQ